MARLEAARDVGVLRVPLFAAVPLSSVELFAADDRDRVEADAPLLADVERFAAAGRDEPERELLPAPAPDDFVVPLVVPELDRALVRVVPNMSPDIIRCAASATASAMSEPRRVALFITEFAALLAVSAASSPASRILRRALGLALIAAAAAASPAASISLLIAALASLSSVSLPVEEERCCDELLSLLRPGPPAPVELACWSVKEALPP